MMSCHECAYANTENHICELFDDLLPYEGTCFMEHNKYMEDKE